MGNRGFGGKKGWREMKLERRRRTPVQPESAMRGGADKRKARAEADVVVSACAGGMLWRGGGEVMVTYLTVRRERSRQSKVRQKGLTKSEESERSGGKATLERGWKD
jgi:hypothetical protein